MNCSLVSEIFFSQRSDEALASIAPIDRCATDILQAKQPSKILETAKIVDTGASDQKTGRNETLPQLFGEHVESG